MSLPLNDVTECLYEPTALGCVPPAVEAGDGAVGNQKVGMAGDPVGGHTVSLRPLPSVHHLDSVVQLVPLAGLQSTTIISLLRVLSLHSSTDLDEEKLWFAGK